MVRRLSIHVDEDEELDAEKVALQRRGALEKRGVKKPRVRWDSVNLS